MQPGEFKIGIAGYGALRQYECKVCGRRFAGLRSLVRHRTKSGHK